MTGWTSTWRSSERARPADEPPGGTGGSAAASRTPAVYSIIELVVAREGTASGPARDVDDYLKALPKDMRVALEKLRSTIKAAVPEAVETISYGIPVFKLEGRPLVGFGAATGHCTFHVMSTGVFAGHASDLKGYKLGKGSIQFQPASPLPAALVKKLIQARIAENRGMRGA
jgi:uncharacterized protein YdhG (YjbR/CyaY superfamily)